MLGSVNIKVRPIRLAHLVDPNNAKQTREAIRLSSTLWGGAYFPIICLYRRMPYTWKEEQFKPPLAENVISGYIEAFDPDLLVQFAKDVPQAIAKTGLKIIKPQEIWQYVDNERILSPKFGIGIFELLDDIYQEHFKYKTKYPVKVLIPKIPQQLSLFWASLLGEIPEHLMPVLRKRYLEPLEIQDISFQLKNLGEVMAGNVLFPRRIAQHGLNQFKHSVFSRDASVFFLDARKVEDIIDFWNLRALGKIVIPLPKQLQQDPQLKEIVINFLREHRRPLRNDPKAYDFASMIRGRNCTIEEMEEYTKTLNIELKPGDASGTPFVALQRWYPRIWDAWAREKDGAFPDEIYGQNEHTLDLADTKELKIGFKPLLPKFAHRYSVHGWPRCADEISFRVYGSTEYLAEVFPKSSGQNFERAISSFASLRGDWRVGRNGLVMLVKNDSYERRELPLAENIVFAWLTDLGFKPRLSTSGLLAKQIYRQLDGYPRVLQNEKLLGLLEHMNGGTVKRDGSPDPSRKVKIGQERELPVGEVNLKLEAASKRSNLRDYLLSKGIFKLGLRTQCSQCLRNSWFSLESLRDTLTCPKCLNVFPAIVNVKNAEWCYKTTGPFSVPDYADGAYAVLLTLEFFSDHNMATMRTSPVFSFKAEVANKKDLEVDFALFWQESTFGGKEDGLVFGECKTYGKFEKKDIDRMRYLGKTFPGAILVFSTLRKTLDPQEVTMMTLIAKAGRKYWKAERPINPVLILTGTELLSWLGPPSCWENSVRKKFDRTHGLLNICDATQQIYLNLPSWHIEWHDKWEKKYKRWQTKKGTTDITPDTAPSSGASTELEKE